MTRPVVTVLALVAALGALVAVGAATTPAAPRSPAAVSAPVQGLTLVCPQLRRAAGRGLDTTVAAGVTALSVRADPASTVSALPLGATDAPVPATLQGAGQAAADLAPVGGDTADGALVLTATGVLAGGLQARQLTRATSGPRRGDEGVACTAPRADTWFAGGSVTDGSSSTLELVNPEDTAAVVDVQIWSVQGQVDPRLGRGIVVPPRGRTSVALDTLAPGDTGLALHVVANQGRVVAAVEHLQASASGATPLGAEWVPISPPPATRVVLPAIPAGPGPRTLLVTNPDPVPTVVQVQLTTTRGQFVPSGLEALPVPAGSTVLTDLTGLLGSTPAAVAVTSQAGPVLAVGLVVDGAGPVHDFSYAGAAPALAGPALVSDVGGGGSQLLLSALAGDASVVLTPLPVAGQTGPLPAPRTVAVPGGSAVVVPFAVFGVPVGTVLAVQVRPAAGSGPVRAAGYLREDLPDGPLTTLLALDAPAQRVPRPIVVADPGAGLP